MKVIKAVEQMRKKKKHPLLFILYSIMSFVVNRFIKFMSKIKRKKGLFSLSVSLKRDGQIIYG